jgi:hypothetical protein
MKVNFQLGLGLGLGLGRWFGIDDAVSVSLSLSVAVFLCEHFSPKESSIDIFSVYLLQHHNNGVYIRHFRLKESLDVIWEEITEISS